MANHTPKLVAVECWGCNGTGLYHGWAEPVGTYAVCTVCDGKAAIRVWNTYRNMPLEYGIYNGRKQMDDVQSVVVYSTQPPAARFAAPSVYRTLSYQDFLEEYPEFEATATAAE